MSLQECEKLGKRTASPVIIEPVYSAPSLIMIWYRDCVTAYSKYKFSFSAEDLFVKINALYMIGMGYMIIPVKSSCY